MLGSLLGNWLNNSARADAAGANRYGYYLAVALLMAHFLQVGLKAAFCFNVGVANVIAYLGVFAAYFTFSGHGVPPYKLLGAKAPAQNN